jgi:hypothetical protein
MYGFLAGNKVKKMSWPRRYWKRGRHFWCYSLPYLPPYTHPPVPLTLEQKIEELEAYKHELEAEKQEIEKEIKEIEAQINELRNMLGERRPPPQ